MSAGKDSGFAGVVGALLPLLGASAQAQAPAVESSHPPFPETEEIVVSAPWGAALVASETELDETRIDAYGANSIGELVSLIAPLTGRSEEHTSELQSLMRISYAVFCLKKKTTHTQQNSVLYT